LGRQNLGDLGPLRRQGDSDSHPAVQGSVQVRQDLGALPPQGLEQEHPADSEQEHLQGLERPPVVVLEAGHQALGLEDHLASGLRLVLGLELLLVLVLDSGRHLVSGLVLRVGLEPPLALEPRVSVGELNPRDSGRHL